MKSTILLIFAIIISSTVFAQSFKVDPETQSMYANRPAYMIDTVVTSSLSKKQLYSNGISFIAATFPDSRDVIQVKDLELGEILFNGIISKKYLDTVDIKTKLITRELTGNLHFKCKLYLKDGKYKIILYGLETSKSNFPEIQYTLDVPKYSGSKKEDKYNIVGRELSISFINDLSIALNKKPDNDF